MLLLIRSAEHLDKLLNRIQIHLMLLLIALLTKTGIKKLHSNTSHVTINHHRYRNTRFPWHIQIHLMLLLIKEGWIILEDNKNSNTSHVTINRETDTTITPDGQYSNTSHVTINHHGLEPTATWIVDSNTSHVTINRPAKLEPWKLNLIQIHLMLLLIYTILTTDIAALLFKYISCYY